MENDNVEKCPKACIYFVFDGDVITRFISICFEDDYCKELEEFYDLFNKNDQQLNPIDFADDRGILSSPGVYSGLFLLKSYNNTPESLSFNIEVCDIKRTRWKETL